MYTRDFEINVEEMGGWIRVCLGRGEPTGEAAQFLSSALTHWFMERPHLQMTAIVPISSNGDTLELHAWYGKSPAF